MQFGVGYIRMVLRLACPVLSITVAGIVKSEPSHSITSSARSTKRGGSDIPTPRLSSGSGKIQTG